MFLDRDGVINRAVIRAGIPCPPASLEELEILPGVPAALNALNKEILLRIQESGLAIPSQTMLDGKFAIRVAITNHRSRREDFEQLVHAVVETGTALR